MKESSTFPCHDSLSTDNLTPLHIKKISLFLISTVHNKKSKLLSFDFPPVGIGLQGSMKFFEAGAGHVAEQLS